MTLGGTNILDLISSANTSGGGYFLVWAETSGLLTTTNTNGYWNFGSGISNGTFRLGIFPPNSTLTYIVITTTGTITAGAPIVTVTKLVGGTNNAGTNVTATINIPIGSAVNSKSVNISFSQGDCLQIQTTTSSGGGGGNSRITLQFETVGVTGAKGDTGETGAMGSTGATPVLSIGTVTSGTTPNAYLTGNATYPVLNLVVPKGDKGDTGQTGATGSTGQTGANGSKGDAGITPTFTFSNITTLDSSYQCTLTTSSLNNTYDLQFGIPRGAMPTIVGATTTLLSADKNPTVTITQVSPGAYSLAFGIPTSPVNNDGEADDGNDNGGGFLGKMKRGIKSITNSASGLVGLASLGALIIATILASAEFAYLQSQITALQVEVGIIDGEITILNAKTQNQTATLTTTNFTSDVRVVNPLDTLNSYAIKLSQDGTITSSGTITCGTITSSGSITSDGNIRSKNILSADKKITCGTTSIDSSGNLSIGSYIYCDASMGTISGTNITTSGTLSSNVVDVSTNLICNNINFHSNNNTLNIGTNGTLIEQAYHTINIGTSFTTTNIPGYYNFSKSFTLPTGGFRQF